MLNRLVERDRKRGRWLLCGGWKRHHCRDRQPQKRLSNDAARPASFRATISLHASYLLLRAIPAADAMSTVTVDDVHRSAHPRTCNDRRALARLLFFTGA